MTRAVRDDRTTIWRAAWVLPMDGAPIAHGAVAVRGDTIVAVGRAADVHAPDARVVDLGDAALMPGLVNVHTHLELTALRHALEGLDFVAWIRSLMRLRAAVLDDDADRRASARVGIAEGLARGITTFADTASRGLPVLEALDDMGARGVVYQEVFGPEDDDTVVRDAIRGLADAVAAMRARTAPLVRTGVSPHAPYSVSRALYAAVARYAREGALPVAVHLAESDAEEQLVTAGTGQFADAWRARGIDPAASRAASPVALLDEAGVLACAPLVIHAVRTDADDLARLARHGCAIAHCPVSNARFGHGIAAAAQWRAAGLAIGIGTDSVASNNRMDLLDEARVAHLVSSAGGRTPDALDAAWLLHALTRGGARALGLGETAGTLAPGRPADLCAFPLDGDAARPAHDVATALVHGVAGAPSRLAMVAGRVRWLDGAHVDAPALAGDRARVATLARAALGHVGGEPRPGARAP